MPEFFEDRPLLDHLVLPDRDPPSDRCHDSKDAGGDHGAAQLACLAGLELGGLSLPLALGFVGAALVVLGDAVIDEFVILRRDILCRATLHPVAGKLQLAA